VRINGTLIASHEFGYVSGSTPEAAVLEGTYTPATTGLYSLEIKNYRPSGTSTSNLINYLDNIVLASTTPMLSADGQTFSSFFGGTRKFELTADVAYAGHDYWLWVGFTGTYPGIKVSGVTIPLNYDILVELGLLYPGFPGTGFVGQLDGSGNASASLKVTANPNYQGATLWLSYIVLSSGMKPPVLAASNPINITFTLME
jgi:hypothetical protein